MDQLVKLNYFHDSQWTKTQRPYITLPGLLKTIHYANFDYVTGPEQLIKDVRGCTETFMLHEQGFTFLPWSPSDIDWTDEADIESRYLPQVKDLLQKELDISESLKRCEVFDWRLRKADSQEVMRQVCDGRMIKIKPADIVHIDQSPAGALDRLRLHLPQQEVGELLKKYRVRIFNVWKPISDVVEDWPLAICDARTVTTGDLVELEFVTDELVKLSYLARWNKKYRFYYLSEMTNRDACIFKIFDSASFENRSDASATLGCPHTAFRLPATSETGTRPRESVEVRLFVFSTD
ncbi:hypothetical protein CFAM422_003773 [Trichoderma lentiforme]|uniref:Uncharacterized protein n=1 Tax=Trichoderma lentiforme TaxID=1567552 RepID=A0A9P5CH55_9HYPO|nr:hypothetical protein CFAM422_003773 [Trichoderma lentiforme]